MSLHDVDKNHSKRMNPKPNSVDEIQQRMAHGTTQNQNSQEVALDDGLKFKERQILAVQDGFEKAIFGFYGDAGKFGLKVAQDGVNVTEATNDQLVFNSEQNTFKIIDSGSTSLDSTNVSNNSSGTRTASIDITSLGLSMAPVVVAYAQFGSGQSPWVQIDLDQFSQSVSAITLSAFEERTQGVTNTTITFTARYYNSSGVTQATTAYTIKYYILQETIA